MTGTGNIEMRNIQNLISGVVAAVTLIMAGAGAPVMAAESTSMEISANVTQPSCTLTFSPASPFSLGTVPSTGFDLQTRFQGGKQLTITLTNCGLGSSSTTPSITLDGNHPNPNEITGGAGQVYLFKNAGDASLTSRGFFILVAKKNNPAFNPTDLWKSGDVIFSGPKGESGNGKSTSVWLGVSCGVSTAGGCPVPAAGPALAGSLKATLKFTFAYK